MDASRRGRCRPWQVFVAPTVVVWMLVSAVYGQSTQSIDQGHPAAPVSRVLLLKNGELMTGTIRSDAESFHVQPPAGGSVAVPRSRVAHLCRDPWEAYLCLAADVSDLDYAGRVRLVQWCLAQRLLPAAEREIRLLRRDAPHHAELDQLTARLEFLGQPRQAAQPQVGTAGLVARPVSSAKPPQLSREAIAEFTAHIQPLLMNSCGTVACHGRGATGSLQLVSPPRGVAANQRLTRRNLAAVLKFVSFVQPDDSPLMRMATTSHAGNPAVFGPRQAEHVDALAHWIEMVTGVAAPPRRANTRPEAAAADLKRPSNHPATNVLKNGKSSASEDPLDPEVFNRQFGGQRAATKPAVKKATASGPSKAP